MSRSKGVEFSEYIKDNFPVDSRSISLRKLVYDVGINDANYVTNPTIANKKVTCPAYKIWNHMLLRAYSQKYHDKKPTYTGVNVCNDWIIFSNFREWFIENHVDNCQLDKDLLVTGNKTYSPETCIFVPQWLNCFITNAGAARGKHLIGVYWGEHVMKFIARCSNPITKKQEHLGCFESETEGHIAWLSRKLEIALELKPEMDEIDLRIYPNVVEIIK